MKRRPLHLILTMFILALNLLSFQNCSKNGLQTDSLFSYNTSSSETKLTSTDINNSTLVPYSQATNPLIKGIVVEKDMPYLFVGNSKDTANVNCLSNLSLQNTCPETLYVRGALEESNQNLVISFNVNFQITSIAPLRIGYQIWDVETKKRITIGLIDLTKKETQSIKLTYKYDSTTKSFTLPKGRYSLLILNTVPMRKFEHSEMLETSMTSWSEILKFSMGIEAPVDIKVSNNSDSKICSNGAKNYPDCNNFAPCANGAINPPTSSNFANTCNICETGKSLIEGICKFPAKNVFVGVGTHPMPCSPNKSENLPEGSIVCYGLIDEGTSWGGDHFTCLDSSNNPMEKCILNMPACLTGKAEGSRLEVSNTKDLSLSQLHDDGKKMISSINQLIQNSSNQINFSYKIGNIAEIWEYRCIRSTDNNPSTLNDLEKFLVNAAINFSESEYLLLYPDVKSAVLLNNFASGLQHYEMYGRKEGRSPSLLFNESAFADEFRSKLATDQNGWEYFRRQNQPTANLYFSKTHFDEAKYLDYHRDVDSAVKAGYLASGLQHYIIYGRSEGRRVFIKDCFLNGVSCDSVEVKLPPKSCHFNGVTIAHGASIPAFLSSSVSYGQACVQENRTCNDGQLSGSYGYNSCSQLAPEACDFNSETIAHGSYVVAYLSGFVRYGQTCATQNRLCNNGQLSGEYKYSNCTIDEVSSNYCYRQGKRIPNCVEP